MDEQVQVEHEAFMRALEKGTLRTLQIIHLAILMGILTFGMIVAMFWFQKTEVSGTEAVSGTSVVGHLTVVHIAIAVVCSAAGSLVFNILAGPKGIAMLDKNLISQNLSAEQKCARAIFTAMIFRLAIFEGAALFGLIVCLLGILGGELAEKPIYWINLVSPAVFVLLVLATFPTRGRMEALFLRRFTDRTPFNTL